MMAANELGVLVKLPPGTVMEMEAIRPLVYLACPYSDPDPQVRQERFVLAARAAAKLMADRGEHVFSPITHSHPIAVVLDASRSVIGSAANDWNLWRPLDLTILQLCRKFYVLCLAGVSESHGVKEENRAAAQLGIEIEFLMEDFIAALTG